MLFLFVGGQQIVHSFPTRRSSDLENLVRGRIGRLGLEPLRFEAFGVAGSAPPAPINLRTPTSAQRPRVQPATVHRSEEHTSELQSQSNLVCRLLLEKKNEIWVSDS